MDSSRQKIKNVNFSLLKDNNPIFWNFSLDKIRLKNFVSWFFKNHGEKKTLQLLEQLKNLGFGYATQAGISLGIEDLKIPPNKNKLLAEAENSISNSLISYRKGEITGIEKRQQFIETWHEISENLKQEVVRYFEKTNILNPVYMMAFSGARGNLSQVRQLVGMRGLMSDPQGKIIEFPIQSNFREGLTLTEYLISTYGARKGIVDTALRTATAGYLTRRLVDVAQHVIVSTFDCGTKRGIFLFDMKEGNKTIYSFSNRLIGRVLAQNIYASVNVNQLLKTEASKSKLGFRNQEINTELATAIAKLHKKALVRSPLTCETRKLVCQLCYGWSLATSRLVSVGEAVGVIAGQSIGEPGTQLTMRTFHTGGVFSGEITEQINAPFSGIAEYSEPISGACIRTPLGFLAFLTKTNGTLFFKKSKMKSLEDDSLHLNKTLTNESSVMNVYKIPSFTVLFARHGEFIEKSKFLAQISLFPTGQKTTQTIEQTIYSSLEGEVYYNQIDLLEDIDEKYGEHISKAEDWSKVWVLSAKISNNTLVSDYLPKCGDFVSKNSIVNQIQWLTNFSQPSYINYNTSNASNFKNSDYSYESKRLFKSFQSYSLSNNKLKSNLTLNSSFNAVLALKTKSIDNFSSNFKIFSKYQKRKKFLLNNINLTNLNQRQIFSVYYLRNIQTCFVYPYQFNFRYNFLKSIAQTVIFLPILGSGVLTNWLNLKSLKHKKNKKQKVMNLVQKQSTVLVKRLNLNKKFKVRHNVVMRGQASRPGGALPPGPQKSPRSGGQGPPQSPRPNGSGGSPRALGPGGGPPRALNKTNFFHPLILANFVSFSSTLNTKTLKNFYKRKSEISNVKLEKSIVYPYFPNNYPNPLSEYNYLNKSDTDFWLYKKSMENVFNKFSFKNQAQLKNLQNSKQKKHHGSSIIKKFEKNKIRNIFFKKTTTLKREQLSIKTPILFLNTEKICYRKLGYFVSIEIEPNKRDQLFSFLPLQNDSSMDIHKIHILNKSLGFSSFLSLKKNLKNTKLKNPNANNTLNLNNTDSWSLNSNQGFYWFPEFSQTITNGIFSVLGPTISQKIFKTKFFKLKTKNTKSAFFYTKKYIQFLNLAQSQITKKNLTNKMNFSKTFRKKKFSKFLKNQEKNKGTIFQSVLFSNLANINLAYNSETKDVRFTNKNFYLSHFNQDSFSKKLQLIFLNIENYQMFHFVSPLNKYPWFEKKSHEKAFNYLKSLNHKSLKQQLKSNYISVKKSFIIDNFKQTEKKDSKKSSERKIFSFSKKDLEYSKNLTVKLNQFKKLSTPFQEIYWLAQENYSLNVLINNNKLKNFGLNESRFIFNSNHTNFNRIKERTNIYLTNYQGLKKEFVFKYDGLLKIHTSEVLNTFNKNGQLDKPVNLNFTKSSSLAHSKLKVKFIKYVLMKKNFKRNLFLNTQTQQNLHKSKVNGLFCVNLKNYNNFLSSLPLLQRTNISTRSPENFTTVKNFAKKKYSKKISKTKNLALNITLKPGWIYKTTNLSNIFNIHKLLISAGNNLLDDICFEQQNIFVEIISLNKMCLPNLFKTDFKNQKSTNSFNTLIKVKNSKCRFLQKNKDIKQKHQKNLLKFGGTNGRWGPRGGETPPQALRFIKPKRTPSASEGPKAPRSPRKLRDVTALFFLIRPLNHRLFPDHQQMKRALYKCMQKKRTNELNSSNFLYKKYFSNELNQQTNALKSLSNFEPLDFQLTRMNLWDSTFVSKKQKFSLFNSKKLNPKQKIEETTKKTSFSTLFPNSFFKSFSKKGQVFYLAKKISNFFSNSSNFRKYERGRNCILEKAYFSNYSVNFTQCKVSLSLSRSSIANASTTAAGFLAYSFPQISLNKEPTRMDFSEYSSTEYNNYLKNQYLRILMIRSSHSLFQKNNAFFSKTQKFSEVSNSLEKSRFRFYKKRIINLQSFLNFYNSMPFFEYSLNQKYGFLANQKLFASSFYKQQFENYFKITVLDSKTIFNETFNGKRFIQKKRNKNVVSDFSRNFPISKNHLILKKNFLKNTMSLGLTSFYSPYEGEVLKIYNQNSDILNLRKSVNVYLETGLEQERQQQKLILTKSDIFGLELPITKVSFLDLKKPLQSPVRFFDSMWGSKQSSNVVLSVPSSESSIWRKIDFFRSFFRTVDSWKNSREWHPLNRGHEKTNFSKTYKPEIFNFNHLEDQTFFNLISTKNSLKFLLFYHERFKRLEKHYYDEFDLNQYKISDFNTHYKNKRYKIKTVSFDLINQNKKLRLGAFVSTGEKFYSNLTFLKSGLIIHLSSKKLTLRKAQFFFISPQAILHTYHGHCLTKNSPVMTLPFQTLKTGDIVQGIPKVEQYLEARTTIRGRLFLNSLPVLLYAIYQRYSSQLNMEKAVQQSFLKIQQILVDGVQRVYRSQGVSIADKHLEIIVRQMTSKVKIVYGGQTGFFPGEFVDLEFVERINRFLMVKIRYEPVVLGITRASLEVDSFLSAASFQQTTKVLSRAAMENKKDFLKGLKENLLVGNLLPAGTGYIVPISEKSFSKILIDD